MKQRDILRSIATCFAIACTFIICFSTTAVWGVTVTATSPETSVVIQSSGSQMEYENPVAPGTKTHGRDILEWEDADYLGGSNYDDWSVVANPGGTIDGSASQVWMRQVGQKIGASTSVPSHAVSVHLVGDNNDGQAQIYVDGIWRATLDMCSSPAAYAWVLVKGLPLSTHTIEVWATGVTGCGVPDVATLGAAALVTPIPTLTEWGLIVLTVLIIVGGALFVIRRRRLGGAVAG